jgi:hypothetical protein
MIENRSVPPDTVLPHVAYQDVDEAIAWLSKTFGFAASRIAPLTAILWWKASCIRVSPPG